MKCCLLLFHVSTFPQPPSSTASATDSRHFQECLVATSREQMLTFPNETKLNNMSNCVPFTQNAFCYSDIINLTRIIKY